MLTPEQRATVRMRFIARAQNDTLSLHPDLCRRVLSEYGCNVVDNEDGTIAVCWPPYLEATTYHYTASALPRQAQRVLLLTAQQDAVHAADALA